MACMAERCMVYDACGCVYVPSIIRVNKNNHKNVRENRKRGK